MSILGEGHVFAIGYGSAERFDIFTLENGDVIVVAMETPDRRTLDQLDRQVTALLGSLKLP